MGVKKTKEILMDFAVKEQQVRNNFYRQSVVKVKLQKGKINGIKDG